MNWRSLLLLSIAAVLTVSFCLEQCTGQDKKPPKEPEPEGPERNLPNWQDISGYVPDESVKKPTVFDYFPGTAVDKMSTPFIIYFYKPNKGKEDKTALACAEFEKKMAAAEKFDEATDEFGCYRCNAKDLDAKVIKKFKVKVPSLLVFIATGKKVYTLTKFPNSDKSLAKKLKKIKKTSDKAVEAAEKKNGK